MAETATESSTLRIAIASDLHAFDNSTEDPEPSFLKTTNPEDQQGKNPAADLVRLINQNTLKADVLLCPGDLGDRANAAGIQYAWAKLHELGKSLGVGLLAATAGNHDLDSRYIHSGYDAQGVLQDLVPLFPLEAESDNNTYWAQKFVTKELGGLLLVVLNSSAYHGAGPEEISHGRVADGTRSRLERRLQQGPIKPVNVPLCHHHPQQHCELDLGDYDAMTGGQQLLDLLGSGRFGRWLVVHGHKHHPKITYAAGGSTSPVVLSAGSLSASLYPKLATHARNQFHQVSISYEEISRFGLVGTVHSWDWAVGEGWAPAAGPKSGLPRECGFGYRSDPALLARRVAELLTGQKVQWREIETRLPEVRYLLPQDFAVLKITLDKEFNVAIQEVDGIPLEVGSI